jgi:glycosyltransferase involved in cell wall biosynthesis
MSETRYSLDYCTSLPRFQRGVSLLCWAYNEEELIGEFLDKAVALMDATCSDYEIVLVDDCSTDDTNRIVREKAALHPRIRIHRNRINRNIGYSSRKAIRLARKEFLFWQTIDWSYDISKLRCCLELLESHDVVLGVRRPPTVFRKRWVKPFVAASQLLGFKHLLSRSDSMGKALISVSNYLLIRILFRVPLSDFQNIVFYRTVHLHDLELVSNTSFGNPEMLMKSHWMGLSIAEVPIDFIPRSKGQAKGTRVGTVLKSVKEVFNYWFLWIILGRREHKGKGPIVRLDPQLWRD